MPKLNQLKYIFILIVSFCAYACMWKKKGVMGILSTLAHFSFFKCKMGYTCRFVLRGDSSTRTMYMLHTQNQNKTKQENPC